MDYLLNRIHHLPASGAQYGALTGFTPNIVFDELEKAPSIPLISMVDTSRDYTEKNGYKKICLLGTLPTINGSFFTNLLKKWIEIITPNESNKNYIGNKIETELEFGKVIPETQDAFKKIAYRIIQGSKVQALVLGCTELPMISKDVKLSVPYLDVMQIHINDLIVLILKD